MGEYADMSFDRDFGAWEDDGYPTTPVYTVRAGDKCSRYGCGGTRVKRVNGKTGQEFLGCSNFPKCKG